MRSRAAPIAVGLATLGLLVWAFVVSGAGSSASPSDVYMVVRGDPTWLEYLPATSEVTPIQVTTLTMPSTGPVTGRRVDLLERRHDASISLCFARARADLQAICPGARVLGQITRDVDKPWAGQLGTSPIDLFVLLNEPAPALDDADSITS